NKREKEHFNFPSLSGNFEENILKYINDRINENENKVTYIVSLAKAFLKSIQFICNDLVKKDEENLLIGDCLILDRNRSLELFLILLHHKNIDTLKVEKWELLLYTWDFHGNYHNKSYKGREKFDWLFSRLFNEEVNDILDDFIKLGFRKKLFGDDLQGVFLAYIKNHKTNILTNGFHFWKWKMTYLLYKYEIKKNGDSLKKNDNDSMRKNLRRVFNKGVALEHILPQNWQSSVNKEQINNEEKVNSVINGIGNLLLITTRENSSLGDKHPQEKSYEIKLGSYKEHESNKDQWKDSNNWIEIIEKRGNCIYDFLLEYFNKTPK
ncbi:MAG: HNH endonuclease, partial [Cytophagales bacterium]|nr:HNH endonuclease [Cytophagales bacterium]